MRATQPGMFTMRLRLPAGTFGFWVAGTKHFAWFEGETILQVHGQVPWTIT